MSLPVTIESQALRVEVYPHFGGKILSIVDKADEYELLFDYPAEFPTTSQYDQPYDSSYYAGWDECFPAVGSGIYPIHPYKGIPIPDHGELWGLPTTAIPTKDGITTEWQGLRFGYRLTRKLWVEGPRLLAEYSLLNLAPFDFHFVWSAHGLLSLHAPAELEMPSGQYHLRHDAERNRVDTLFEWPNADCEGATHNFTRPLDLPSKRAWKSFTDDPIRGPVVVRYPTRNRSLRIEFSSADGLAAYWGVWLNNGTRGGQKYVSIEPTTGRFDELDRSLKDGSAGRIAAGGRVGWLVHWTVGS